MTSPYRPEPGTPVDELETPVLIVELDALESNFGVIAETYRNTTVKMRQHTKNVKSPLVARKQMEIGGTLGGVCTAKLAEAEVMVEGGITDILIPNQIVTRDKLARLSALARQGDMKVSVDNPDNLRDISEAATAYDVDIGVLVEVDTMMGRAGVRAPEQGVELAKLAMSLPGVTFRGVMSHQTIGTGPTDRESRFLGGRADIQRCLDVKNAIEEAGIEVEIVSTAETHTYDIVAEMDEVTETEGGTYAMMSTGFPYMEEFQIANKVLGTVVSARDDTAIGDVGSYAMARPANAANPNGILPSIESVPGVRVEALHADHIVLKSEGAMPLAVGDRFVLLPGHQDMLVNRWDAYVAVRNGVVEEVWDIPARGCFN